MQQGSGDFADRRRSVIIRVAPYSGDGFRFEQEAKMCRENDDRTTVEMVMENKRAVERLEGGYDYADVKFALVVLGIFIIIALVVRFVMTGEL